MELKDVLKDAVKVRAKIHGIPQVVSEAQALADDFVERRLKEDLNRFGTRLGAVVVRELLEKFNQAVAAEVTEMIES